jgi:hypothetical protein
MVCKIEEEILTEGAYGDDRTNESLNIPARAVSNLA